jgi:hypothetical protein
LVGSFVVIYVFSSLVFCSKDKDKSGDNTGVLNKGTGETFLDVHFVLGSTPEELIERFGEPKPYIHEREGVPGNMVWKNLYDVRVFTVIRDGRCAYVHYTFNELEPFDEGEAFQVVGIERPKHDPILIPQSEARRWKPFEEYDRLTVNPKTKGVAVRAYPFRL